MTQEERIRRQQCVEDTLKELNYNKGSFNVKYYRRGMYSISDDGKLNIPIKKLSRIHNHVKVNVYYNDSVTKFLWKMVEKISSCDELQTEVEISRVRNDVIEVKGVVGSRSKIVGKIPDDIYNEIKDKIIDISIDFISHPNDLTVSIFEVEYINYQIADPVEEFYRQRRYSTINSYR